jgi:GNAT superfamily N-acetyltransferase
MTLQPTYEGPRTPTEQEWPAVLELTRSIFFKDMATYWDGYRRWPMSLHPGAREQALTMFREGQPVSSIGRLERDILVSGHRLRLGFVGSVCTHPDHRGQGLAGAIFDAVLERFRRDGADLVFISGTRPLYFGAGANHVAIEERFLLGKEGLSIKTPEVHLRQAGPEDISQLVALSEAEGTRIIRPWLDWEIVLREGYCRGRQSSFHLVTWQGAPIGYVLSEQDPRQHLQVVTEVAGDRLCLLTALEKLSALLAEEKRLQVNLPRGDRLSALLRQIGVAEERAPKSGGTMIALDFCRLIQKLTPYFQERLPDWGNVKIECAMGKDRYTAWCEGGYLQITGETNMLWLLLGRPAAETGFAGNVQISGRMGELVERCLPIPLPSLSMNMI